MRRCAARHGSRIALIIAINATYRIIDAGGNRLAIDDVGGIDK